MPEAMVEDCAKWQAVHRGESRSKVLVFGLLQDAESLLIVAGVHQTVRLRFMRNLVSPFDV